MSLITFTSSIRRASLSEPDGFLVPLGLAYEGIDLFQSVIKLVKSFGVNEVIDLRYVAVQIVLMPGDSVENVAGVIQNVREVLESALAGHVIDIRSDDGRVDVERKLVQQKPESLKIAAQPFPWEGEIKLVVQSVWLIAEFEGYVAVPNPGTVVEKIPGILDAPGFRVTGFSEQDVQIKEQLPACLVHKIIEFAPVLARHVKLMPLPSLIETWAVYILGFNV